MTEGPLFGETGSWIYITVHLIMLKCILYNVLRISLYNVSHLMLKFSLFVERLSEKFITTEHPDLSQQFIQNRCKDYLSVDQDIRNEKSIELKNIISNITNASMNESNTESNSEIIEEKRVFSTEIDAIEVEKIHNWKMQMITKTLKSNELQTKLNIDKESYKSINNEDLHQEKERTPKKKYDNLKRGNHSFKQDTKKNNSLIFTPIKNDTLYRSLTNRTDQSIHKNEISINSSKKIYILNEVYDDINKLPPEFALAHCISGDLQMISRSSCEFKFKSGQIGVLMDQNLRNGDVGEIFHNEKYIFYLIIKKRVQIYALKKDLENACYNLLSKMNKYKLTKLAIPKSGLDDYTLLEVKEIFAKVFSTSGIEISLYISTKLNIYQPAHPKINTTSKSLWKMEPQTDLIMFINMEQMYLNDWKDEVVENINAKYPFKDRLLEDINIKPVAAGDILTYKIGTELLICIFVMPMNKNPTYFTSLEKAFTEMKSLMTGYRYLGIQYVPMRHEHYNSRPYYCIPRNLLLLREIFDRKSAEIWLCGDPKQDKTNDFKLYNRFVQNAITQNIKQSKNLKNIIFKAEEQKYNWDDYDL